MLELYQSFVQVIGSETLVDAAEVLHTTQPTLTRQIKQLEALLGVQLFDHVGRRLVVNRAGELVYQYAKRLIATEQRMRDELSAFGNPELGTIFMGAGLTPSIYILPALIAAYRTAHPQVRFHVMNGSSKEIYNALLQREIDIGVVTTVDEDSEQIQAVPLWKDELLLVAKPDHPLVSAENATLKEVTKSPFVLMKTGSGLRQLVLDLAMHHQVEIDIIMETDSLESLNRLVQHGVGLSILPRSSVQDDLVQGRLAEIELLDAKLASRTMTLITRRTSSLPAVAAQFSGFLSAWST